MKSRIGRKGTVFLAVVALAATAVAGGALAAVAARGTAASTAVTIKATESNYKIVLSKTSVAAGSTVTFRVFNNSATSHKFGIKKTGFTTKSVVGVIGPGKTKYLTVTLPKGTYTVFCAIHIGSGMKRTLYVGTTAPGTTTHPTTTTTHTYTYTYPTP